MATGQHLLSQQQHPIADRRLHNVRLIVLLTALLGWPNASSCDNSLFCYYYSARLHCQHPSHTQWQPCPPITAVSRSVISPSPAPDTDSRLLRPRSRRKTLPSSSSEVRFFTSPARKCKDYFALTCGSNRICGRRSSYFDRGGHPLESCSSSPQRPSRAG